MDPGLDPLVRGTDPRIQIRYQNGTDHSSDINCEIVLSYLQHWKSHTSISTVGSPSLNAKNAEVDLLSQFIMGPRVKNTFGLVKTFMLHTVLRIRIHMFLGLSDPDPLVRCMDPDPDPSIIMQK